MEAKRILERRARLIAAALASCTPAARPVDHATLATIPPLPDADAPDAPPEDAGLPPMIEDSGVPTKIVVSVCLSTMVLPKITFPAKTAKLSPSPTLEEASKVLLAHPQIDVEIEGHTTPDEQLLVGQQRADAVQAELVRRGIAPTRLTTSNAGSSKPLVADPADARNRRVELIVR